MLISVVFSFRNEEDVLPELIRRTTATLEGLHENYELIFINDASTDQSLGLLRKAHEQNSRIKVISMSRRFGGAPCVLAGFSQAKGDVVVYMDTDLQDPPETIPALVEQYRKGADVVHTTRTKRKGENPIKLFITNLAYRAISALADIPVPRDTGDFKLLSRRAVDHILSLKETDPFLRGMSLWIGFKQVQVHYERDARFAGETKYSLLGSLNPVKEFLRGVTSFSVAPLYFSLILGFTVSMGAFAYLIYIAVSRVLLGYHLPGWPALMVTMLFLGGTILFTIGVLGIYLGRIYNEIKQRPRYIIESTFGFEDVMGQPPS